MDKVLYRNLEEKDYEDVRKLIGEAFGFNKFIKNKKFLHSLLNIYLQNCILDSSFSGVAEKNNKVVGIILGSCKKDKTTLRKPHNLLSIGFTLLKLILSNKENRKILKEFSKIHNTYEELIKGREADFGGCIQLFIVSEECRGLGVGKSLLNDLFDYMRSMDVKSLYLYTDSLCNYGFYESQNFKRLNEKEVYFDSLNSKLNVFLYEYVFND